MILFNHGSKITTRSPEETERLRAETVARGAIPQVLPREGFVHRKHDEFEELKGAFIELNQETLTEEARIALGTIEQLDRQLYGTTWRIWIGGIPTQEQMDAAPWEA